MCLKILVNGAGGQLGQDVMRQLHSEHDVVGFTRNEWDVTDIEATKSIIERERPQVVIHCAAFTKVDQAEVEPTAAFRVNTDGARSVAAACGNSNVTMVYISTDYVFDGTKASGYDERDQPNPINVYGHSKEAGERVVRHYCGQHFILRTSWLFGPNGTNFLTAIGEKARTGAEIAVVNDQRGSPTYTGHLAAKVAELIRTSSYGTYHTAGSGACTWYEFAHTFVEQIGWSVNIVPITSEGMARKAKRPTCSILRSCRLPDIGMTFLPHWTLGVAQFIKRWKGGKKHD